MHFKLRGPVITLKSVGLGLEAFELSGSAAELDDGLERIAFLNV
jgi:hypothetical protein